MDLDVYRSLDAHLGIIGFDKNLSIYYCNEKFASLTGLSLDQLIGMHLLDKKLPFFIRSRSVEFYQQVLRGKDLWENSRSGGTEPSAFQLHFLPVLSENGFQDKGLITLRKAENAVDDIPDQHLSNYSTSFYTIVDEEGRVYFYYSKYSGPEETEKHENLPHGHLKNYLPSELLPRYLENIRKTVSSNKPLVVSEPGLCPTGESKTFLVQHFPIRYESDKSLVGIIATDLSEVMRKEKRSELLNSLLKKLIRLSAQLDSDTTGRRLPASLSSILKTLTQISSAKLVLLFRKERNKDTYQLISHYQQESTQINLQQLLSKNFGSDFSWIKEELKKRPSLVLPNLDALPPEAQEERESLRQGNISSLLVTGIKIQEESTGFLCFVNLRENSVMMEDVIKTLEIAAFQLGHFFRNYETTRKLEKSKREYQLLARNISDVVSIHSLSMRCLFISPSVSKILGYKLREYIGRVSTPHIHPEDRKYFDAAYQKALSGENVVFRHRHLHKDGYYVWVESSGKIVRVQGEALLLLVTRDISQQKQAEDQLKQREEYFKSLIRSQSNYLIRTDMQGMFTFANQRFIEQFEIESPIHGQSFFPILHPDDLEKCLKMAKLCAQNPNEIYQQVLRKPKKEGGYFWSDWEFTGIPDASGKVVEIQAVGTDITEKKEALLTIEKSEAFLKSLINNNADAIWAVDAEQRLAYANPSFLRYMKDFMGLKLDIGMRIIDHVPESERQRWKSYYDKAAREGHFNVLQAWNHQGTDYYFEVSFNPILDEDGNYLGHSVFAHNTTQQKNTELELVRAKHSLEEAIKARGTFLSMITHELKTPLNAITGMSSLMKTTRLSKEQRKYVDTLAYSSKMLNSLINDILDYTSMQAGEFKMEKITFNLRNILEQTINLYQAKAREKGIRLRNHFDERLPSHIKGDPVRLGQIFNNLLDNAFKFTKSGKITIRMMPNTKKKESTCMLIKVTDTGIGIPTDKLGEIFEPFKQADAEINRIYGGRGLGLAIVKNLVEHQGGSISVESTVEQGTTFTVCYPYEAADTQEKSWEEAGISYENANLSELRVLYIEDVTINQTLMKGIFQNWGSHLDVVSDGWQGIEMVKRSDYDLILMDLLMPGLDGYETAGRIRALKKAGVRQIPIIAVSAFQGKQIEKRIREAGINDYISKPIDFQKLHNIILRYTTDQPESDSRKQPGSHEPYLNRLEQFAFKDKEQYRNFLTNLKNEFINSRKRLEEAVQKGDNSMISVVRHHNSALLSMFSGEHKQLLNQLHKLQVRQPNDPEALGLLSSIKNEFFVLEQNIEQRLRA